MGKIWKVSITIFVLLFIFSITIIIIAFNKVNFFETMDIAEQTTTKAFDIVKVNEDAISMFGSPMMKEKKSSGRFNGDDSNRILTGSQDISGPNRKGTIIFKAIENNGNWDMLYLEVQTDDGKELKFIDQLPKDANTDKSNCVLGESEGECNIYQGLKCLDFCGNTGRITLKIKNNAGENIHGIRIVITADEKEIYCQGPNFLKTEEESLYHCDSSYSIGMFNSEINAEYLDTRLRLDNQKGEIEVKLS